MTKETTMRIIVFLGALLWGASAWAQPAPSGLDGGYWAGGACNAITFTGPNGPRTVMVDANGNLCVIGTSTVSGSVTVNPGQRTLVALDVASVTTGGTAVNALAAGHATAGGFIYNPTVATVALCINQIGVASGTSSAGNTTCIQPGQPYNIVPSANAVSVISSDSTHAFSGMGLQ